MITLARIGSLDLLRQLADQIVIPDAVYAESVSRAPGRPGSLDLAQADWITCRTAENQALVQQLRTRIGLGESEAIVLTREIGADAVVLDDATARRLTEQEGCRVVGLLGLPVTVARFR
ncbi:MAG: hypothetical protein P0119_10945 [Nitrospira sp.]|nr:hypothetical protein [Nitrospira sp.]